MENSSITGNNAGNTGAQVDENGFFTIGTIIADRYEILAHIGSGAMGEVYKVRDMTTDRLYALKMISPLLAKDKLMAKRLEHEATAARTLVHGNIVSVYDVGNSLDGTPFLLMDYVDGESLEELLKKETVLTQERAVPIFLQLAEALVHAQQKGIIHRDLKPSNILIAKNESNLDIVKIVDFGIAKITDQDRVDKTKLTQTGELVGTPLYMSPEQCRGDEIDQRSDIYSAGCIMYEVLCGQPAFSAENPVKVILKHLGEAPPAMPNNAGISADLKNLVFRCLEKDPQDRYLNAVDLHIDLERIADRRPIRPYKKKRKPGDKKWIAVAACLTLLAVGSGGAIFLNHHEPAGLTPEPQPQRATTFKDKSLAQWTSLIESDPTNPELYFNRGELHAMRDERTNAVDDFSEAIRLKPNYLIAYEQRSQEYNFLAQYGKAEADAQTVIKLDPESSDGYKARAVVYNAMERYDKAIADYTKAAAISDRSYDHYMLASAMLKLARYKDAEHQIDVALKLSDQGDNGPWYGIRGISETFRRDFPEAEKDLKIATTDGGRGVEFALLSYYYVCTGQLPDAERAIQKAQSLETFPARGFRLAAELHRTAGDYDKAIQQFSASTSLEEYPPGYRERATCYIAQEQWRSAYADLKKALDLNPYSATTLSYLALTETKLGLPGAKEHMQKATADQNVPAIVWVNKAWMELMNNGTNAALSDVNKALKQDPYLKEGYAVRAMIEQKTSNASGANADNEKAKNLVSHYDL